MPGKIETAPMKDIFLKEIASSLRDARLYLGFVFIVLGMGVGGLLYGRHHLDSLAEYSKAVAVEEEKMRGLSFRLSELAEEEFKAYRKPRNLQFAVDGEDEMRPNMIPYSTANVGNPVVASSLSYQMRRYERLDWTFAVGILATFLAVVMSFNALSGEKEEGTLKLLLTNRISRTSVLTAKLLALTASVFFPVLVGVLISMALMTLVTGIPYSGADLLRITAVLSMSLLLVLLFVSMGLFVSALMGQSSKSLVLLLLVWVVSVVIIPSLGRLITENVRAVVPAAEIERRIGELLGEAIEEYSGRDISHAPREALPVDASEFLWDEMMDKVEGRAQEIMDGNMRAKMDQVRIMEGIARISPVFLFKLGAWDMAGTGRLEDEHFAEDVRNEREEFLEFIRSQDAQDGGSPHILYRKWYLSYKAVDPAAVPRYTGGEVPVEISLRRGLPEAIGLAVWAAVMFLLAHVAFQRMDAR